MERRIPQTFYRLYRKGGEADYELGFVDQTTHVAKVYWTPKSIVLPPVNLEASTSSSLRPPQETRSGLRHTACVHARSSLQQVLQSGVVAS
jgi:hypothetical protein